MNQKLMRIVLDQLLFYDLCDDTLVDPDTAVAQLEAIGAELKDLSPPEQMAFIRFVEEEARRPDIDERKRKALVGLPESMGLLDHEESAAA